MSKPCNTMNLNELREYAISNSLTATGTGCNGTILKKDLLKVCDAHQKASYTPFDYVNYINSFQGKLALYDSEIDFRHRAFTRVIEAFNETRAKDIVPNNTVKYLLRECIYYQSHGKNNFDDIIPILTELSTQ